MQQVLTPQLQALLFCSSVSVGSQRSSRAPSPSAEQRLQSRSSTREFYASNPPGLRAAPAPAPVGPMTTSDFAQYAAAQQMLPSIVQEFPEAPEHPVSQMLNATTNQKLLPGYITSAFDVSPLREDLVLAELPRCYKYSPNAMSCEVYFDIWDSQQGTCSQWLIRKLAGNGVIRPRPVVAGLAVLYVVVCTPQMSIAISVGAEPNPVPATPSAMPS
ncbi:hypothetical protein DFP72DRAFT_1065964 [Ephemerocybe angulata]|uniref:Uncharacterized protein n=1 Tax=Ephemerocybe angulata TaxID=980116 RepID=A0A8H6I1U1_9AGAR|nr:hypothetical protein DFP72DRAFT_1065964 [Tulosesus angulatus]